VEVWPAVPGQGDLRSSRNSSKELAWLSVQVARNVGSPILGWLNEAIVESSGLPPDRVRRSWSIRITQLEATVELAINSKTFDVTVSCNRSCERKEAGSGRKLGENHDDRIRGAWDVLILRTACV